MKYLVLLISLMGVCSGCILHPDQSPERGQKGRWTGTRVDMPINDGWDQPCVIAAMDLSTDSAPKDIRIFGRQLETNELARLFGQPVPLCHYEERGGPMAIPASEFEPSTGAVEVKGIIRNMQIYAPDRVRRHVESGDSGFKFPEAKDQTTGSSPFVLYLKDSELRKLGWKGPIATSWDEPATQPTTKPG